MLWLRGYPEQAQQRSQAALTLARELSHPPSLGAALFFQVRREPQLAREQAEAAIALALEHDLSHWMAYGTIMRGAAVSRPSFLALLAEAHAAAGQSEAGLKVIAEALALVDHTEERYWEAEIYRVKGELLLRQVVPDAPQAEACFRQAIAVASRQQARSWELRAAISLGRLWQHQGKRGEAHPLLATITGWFTEGFDTPDLQEARALLEERVE